MNILLVDDEDYVLDYLEEQIPWTTLGIMDVYRANSAVEALKIAEEISLSIIMTDIRMPETSGVELLATLQRYYPSTKVILLSGYSEFEYALKALQYGAADYLLKPVTEDEILICLKKVLIKIEDEKRRNENLLAASDVLKLGIGRMREHLLLDLLLGKKYASKELQRHLKSLHLPIETDTNCVLALIRIETGTEETKHEDFELLSYALLNITEEILFEKIDDIPALWSCKDSHRFVISLIPIGSADEHQELNQRMTELQQAVHTYMKRTVSIIITQPFSFQRDLHRQYLQSLNLFWRLVGTQSGLVLAMNKEVEETGLKPLTQLHQSPTMQHLMEAARWEEVISKLDLILEELNMAPYRTQQHLMEAVYYLFSCFSYIAHKQGDSFADMAVIPSLQHESFYFQSTEKIKEWAIPLIEQFKRSLQEVTPARNHIIRKIHDYITHNLQDDVTLTRISEQVYLHPVYLSRLYKKETGESLSVYISRTRMEKAAELLKSTNKKVADIAKEVGYQKTQYFIHIFKEYYNNTPQNYRNL